MKKLKRNIVVVAVMFFVCAAVYLNWSYNNRWGESSDAMVEAQDMAIAQAELEYTNAQAETDIAVSSYFSEARLTRQQSRDEALELLEMAATSASASAEVIDTAMSEISVMATYTMNENQLENQLIARDFADCVVFMTDDTITVAVPSPTEGLDETAVAQITETVIESTGYLAEQLKVIEVRETE